jgi:hypothetical protein
MTVGVVQIPSAFAALPPCGNTHVFGTGPTGDPHDAGGAYELY